MNFLILCPVLLRKAKGFLVGGTNIQSPKKEKND